MRRFPMARMAAFTAALRQQEGIAARTLEFAILTAARTGEDDPARHGRRINMADRLWIIPGARMKVGKEHRVPLSGRAPSESGGIAEGRAG